jgi:oxalate decarboxylase
MANITEPIRNGLGATILGPRNLPLERENPDVLIPPGTDAGTVPNLKYSFAAAHNRMLTAGWAREVTVRELPIATELAGVNMRLEPYGVREMHWHKEAEWAYMLAGSARITAVDQVGRTFIDDVGVGDLWNFPAGIPHSIQGLEDGCEFLLVFDDGNFSENETFLLSDWFKHTPPEILAKNFGVPAAAFARIPQDPDHERYIFPGPVPGMLEADAVPGPAGKVPQTFSHRLLAQDPVVAAGGTARIVDSSNFPAASTIAAALVEVEPGGLRELHWHPNTDEWQYYISGRGRMTVFASGGKARTFDYEGGDVGYVPFAMGHYVENTGDEPLRFLEMFRSDHFADVSLSQWMGLTPHALVQSHLNLDDVTAAALPTDKPLILAGGRTRPTLDALPVWPGDTIAQLTTLGDASAHTIPVTAPLRAGDRRVLFALYRDHTSLDRLRKDPHVALTILAAGNEAFTARGRARVVEDPMSVAPQQVAVLVEVDSIEDHRTPGVSVESGPEIRFNSEAHRQAALERTDALREIAARLDGREG